MTKKVTLNAGDIELNPEQRRALEDNAKALRAGCRAVEERIEAHSDLEAMLAGNEQTIPDLERKAAALDLDAEVRLVATKTQRARIVERINAAFGEVESSRTKLARLHNDMQESLVRLIQKPLTNQLQTLFAEAVAGFFGAGEKEVNRARYLARETTAQESLGRQFTSIKTVSAQDDVEALLDECTRLAARIEAVLAGGEVWSFAP